VFRSRSLKRAETGGRSIRQPEHAFLEDWVAAVPRCKRKAEQLLFIADAGDAILAPVIRAGSGLVMGEIVPGLSILAVVLSNRSPLPLAQVRTPFSPFGRTIAGFLQPGSFLCHG
jgi:hypothetical protein